MARYERTFDGERRTVTKTIKLTPSEDAQLTQAAEAQGTTWSDYARELLLHRSAAVVAGTRRNPEAKAVMEALYAAAVEHNANGNNLNQIARHLNTTGDLRDWPELRQALVTFERIDDRLKAATDRVLAL